MSRPTILIADDHSMVIDGLRSLLEPEFHVIGTVNDGHAVPAEVERLKPDLLIVDISMPTLNGIDCTRLLRESGCTARILVLTMHPDATLAREAIGAGASGYLLKTASSAELKHAVSEVLQGRTYLSPEVTRDFLDILGRAGSRDDAWAKLTPRQREVLQLVAEGKSHKEIAAVLNVSVKTAEYHKYAILDNLGLKTNAELVQYAIRHGIIAI
ncbi:MAG: response regulator transcription factor [Bryobacterales bacterium]|nr:response regulator transcription factor [Bryobacterales bacterium]